MHVLGDGDCGHERTALRRRRYEVALAQDSDDLAIWQALESRTPPGWQRAGFERPLAGLVFYVATLLVLLGPYLYITALVIPSLVQPYPRVDGALGTVEELVLLAWALADFGLTAAIVRAVAQLRRTRPERLLCHLRLLVRWQLVVACALALTAALASTLVPLSQPLVHRALQLRACTAPLLVFATIPAICEALQRYDRQLVLELLDKRCFALLLPIPCILVARAFAPTLSDEPAYALLGLVAGQGAASLATGLVGLAILRRLGLPLRALLSGALPDRAERAPLYRFGAGIMAGKTAFFAAGALELAIILAHLPDYTRALGVKFILLGRLLLPLWLLWPFAESVVPTLTDALAAGKRMLARASIVRYVQHGHLFVGTLFAVVLGGAPPLIRALLPADWHAAATLLPLAGLTGLLLPLPWVADGAQRAHAESGRNAAYVLGEQTLRLALLWLLLPRHGLTGLFAATVIATALKTCAVLLDVHRRRLPLSFPVRVVFVGPAVGALVVGLSARALVLGASLLPLPIAIAGPLALLLATVIAFPLALFVAGLTGSLEPGALAELEAARALAPLPRLLAPGARAVSRAAQLGARLGLPSLDSPLTVAAAEEAADPRLQAGPRDATPLG